MIEQREARKTPLRQSVVPAAKTEPIKRGPLREDPAARKTARWIDGEPALEDLLRDPLVHAVLRRDGLTLRDLLEAIALGRHRLTQPAAESDAA